MKMVNDMVWMGYNRWGWVKGGAFHGGRGDFYSGGMQNPYIYNTGEKYTYL